MERTLRADAARNRALILGAAEEAFAERGLDCGVAEIARRAGVGAGTLFRHFPTKDDLVMAILERRMDEVVEGAERAGRESPWEGLELFMREAAAIIVEYAGFHEAMERCEGRDELKARFKAAAGVVLERAQTTGEARADLTADDLSGLIGAAAMIGEHDVAGGAQSVRAIGIMLDGMRADADAASRG
jgi:AcrR family transcriptional regulator